MKQHHRTVWFTSNNVSCLGLVFLFLCSLPATSMAASLSFLQSNQSEQSFQLVLLLDQVDKLAGMKVVITYDKDTLKFVEAKKTKATDSLMHVVNDRIPGKIIVVLAGAKGISGKNVQLINLFFNHLTGKTTQKISLIKVTQVQLMSEKLKKIADLISK